MYYKKGVDQVVTKNVAPSTGASESVSINDGDVENRGWDLAVSLFLSRLGTGCGVYHLIQVRTIIKY